MAPTTRIRVGVIGEIRVTYICIAISEGRSRMIQKGVKIEAPSGKLGVLIPGLGAVSTTFIAGVEAIKKKIALPVGSLTQLGTIRLGKRTERRVPKIQDFVPLASLDSLVFGGWDIYQDNGYESAGKAGVLDKALLEAVKP